MEGPSKEQFLRDQLNAALAPYVKDEGRANSAQVYDGRSGKYFGKKVRPKHRMVVMLAESGLKQNEIAELTGYTPGRVSIILNAKRPELEEVREDFRKRVADNISDIHLRLRAHAGEMLDIMVAHARDTTQPVNSRQAAKEILHMAGYSPIKKQMNMDIQPPSEELIRAAATIRQANEVAARRAEWAVTKGEAEGEVVEPKEEVA